MAFFKRNKIPKWVEVYPHEMDRLALVELASRSKIPLEAPREMNFVLTTFSTIDDAESAGAQAKEKGWRFEVFKDAADEHLYVVQLTKDNYEITEESYQTDTAYFHRLADMYAAEYDGWHAEAPDKKAKK